MDIRRRKILRARLHLWALAVPTAFAAMSSAQAASPAWVTTASRTPVLDHALQREALAAGEPVHVAVSLAMRDAPGLAQFNDEVTRAGSPAYEQFLSSQQFLDRFAPSAADAAAVADHLRQAGFVNVEVAPNRMLVTADGTPGTVKNAFNTTLARFEVEGGRSAFANLGAVQVPAALGGKVQSVLGLQNVGQFRPLFVKATTAALQPNATTATTRGIKPTEFPKIYAAGSTATGASTKVGIVSEGDLTQTVTDLRAFEAASGLPQQTVSIVQVGAAGTDTSGTDEWDLDSQDIQAMAGGQVQTMVFYDTTSLSNADITAAYNKAVADNVVKVINVSLGECETSAQSDGTIAADDAIFQQAIAQGQTFSVSSGDSGSHECSVFFATNSNTKQSYPASSPYVIAVGGTTLSVDGSGNWAGETTWSGGGGGPSTLEAKPSWQTVVSGTKRGVPDVSFDADPNSGAIIYVNGSTEQVGGTSLASPLFVGTWARIESANGNAKGFPASSIYRYFPSNKTLYHDVTSGSNCGGTFFSCSNYTAAAGWDFATGFGSPIVGSFASFVAATPGF